MAISGIPPLAVAAPAGRAAILVVEDEFLIRIVICDELRVAGYRVIEAASADEALAMLQSGVEVDLIFSDVRTPGAINGLELLAEVRKASPDLPVIIASGHLQPDTTFDDTTDFLSKPYNLNNVVNLINNRLKYQ